MDGMNVCEGAIEVLEKRGWHQGSFQAEDGRVCTVGAINVVVVGVANALFEKALDGFPARRAVVAELRERNELQVGYDIADWNDAPGRTVEEVIEVLRYAAKREAGLRAG